MVTKGIIKSIDFNGNTCVVRIPLFEPAGGEAVEATAIFSNTPGMYNGYLVDDVVLVAFEDGMYEQPVVIGKLYLGANVEKSTPRGVVNCKDSTIAEKANIPFDTTLNSSIEDDMPNTQANYKSIVEISNELNDTNTHLDNQVRDINNELVGKIDSEKNGTSFGWKVTEDSWSIFKKTHAGTEQEETKTILYANEDGLIVDGQIEAQTGHIGKFIIGDSHTVEYIPITLTASTYQEDTYYIKYEEEGHVIYRKATGAFSESTTYYEKINPGISASGIYSDNYISSFDQIPSTDNGVYVGTDGIKVGKNFSVDSNGNVIAKTFKMILNIETKYGVSADESTLPTDWYDDISDAQTSQQYPWLWIWTRTTYTNGVDVTYEDAYSRSSASKIISMETRYKTQTQPTIGSSEVWSDWATTPSPEVGKYTISWTKITYADGGVDYTYSSIISGNNATSYWLDVSALVHTGALQQNDIVIKAWKRVGQTTEELDSEAYIQYKWKSETTWKPSPSVIGPTLTITKATINGKEEDLQIRVSHKSSNPQASDIYDSEEVTYSPLNTPVLDLSNDNASIAYDGNTKLGNPVTSTATVYLNGAAVPNCTFEWTASNCTISGENTQTVTVSTISDNHPEGTVTCKVWNVAGYSTITETNPLTKVFTITKQLKGDKGADSTVPGPAGQTVESVTAYYKLIDTQPSVDDRWSDAEITSNGWAVSPQAWLTTTPTNYKYWIAERTIYRKADNSTFAKWGAVHQANMLSVNFLDAIGIKAKSIQVNGPNGGGLLLAANVSPDYVNKVKIGEFTVANNGTNGSLYNGMTYLDDTTHDGVYIGTDGIALGKGAFKVSHAGKLIATDAEIDGKINATSGTIGGCSITNNQLLVKNARFNGLSIKDSLGAETFAVSESGAVYINGVSFDGTSLDTRTFTMNSNTCIGYGVSRVVSRYTADLIVNIYINKNCTDPDLTFLKDPNISYYLTYENPRAAIIPPTATITYHPVLQGGTKTVSVTLEFNSSKSGWTGEVRVDDFDSNYGIDVVANTYNKSDVVINYNDYNLNINGRLRPTSDATFDLGSIDHRWRSIYAQSSSIITSDKNLKTDLNYNLANYEAVFDKLKPASFKLIDGTSNRTHIGLIAQDVEEAILESNLTSNDYAVLVIDKAETNNKFYGLRYDELHGLEIWQIQKLKKRIKELEDKIDKLEKSS